MHPMAIAVPKLTGLQRMCHLHVLGVRVARSCSVRVAFVKTNSTSVFLGTQDGQQNNKHDHRDQQRQRVEKNANAVPVVLHAGHENA